MTFELLLAERFLILSNSVISGIVDGQNTIDEAVSNFGEIFSSQLKVQP